MPRALTLAEAAAWLGVKPQRISQMLRSGDLSGPAVGQERAPKGAGRVWESSLKQEIDRRKANGRRKQRSDTSENGVHAKSSTREASMLEATLRMKIRLDDAREALREERRVNRMLTSMLTAVVAELEAMQTQNDRLDNIAEGYSEALRHFLVHDDLKDLP